MDWGKEKKIWQEWECKCGTKHEVIITLDLPTLMVKQTNYGEFKMELSDAGLTIEIEQKN